MYFPAVSAEPPAPSGELLTVTEPGELCPGLRTRGGLWCRGVFERVVGVPEAGVKHLHQTPHELGSYFGIVVENSEERFSLHGQDMNLRAGPHRGQVSVGWGTKSLVAGQVVFQNRQCAGSR